MVIVGLNLRRIHAYWGALAYTCAVVATDRFSKRDDPLYWNSPGCIYRASSYILVMVVEGPSSPLPHLRHGA